MKKLFMAAAALTIAIATAPVTIGSSEAASAKRAATATADWGPGSQYCKLASFQRNAPSWNEHYGCLKTSQRQAVDGGARAAPDPQAQADLGRRSGPRQVRGAIVPGLRIPDGEPLLLRAT